MWKVESNLWTIVYLMATLGHLEGTCDFPEALQGSWRGLDDTKLTFTANELTGFKLNVPNLSESDFDCISSSSQGETTKYLLRAKDSVTVFGIRPTLYMCLEVNGDQIKYYAIDTSMNTILQDHIYGIVSNAVPSEQQVCDNPNQAATYMVKLSEVLPRQPKKKRTFLSSLLDRLQKEIDWAEEK